MRHLTCTRRVVSACMILVEHPKQDTTQQSRMLWEIGVKIVVQETGCADVDWVVVGCFNPSLSASVHCSV